MEIKKIIESEIKNKGYISIDNFMRIAMSDKYNSYYRNSEPLGDNGDFITSPEVSQMFGEMVALWAIDAWNKLGRPGSFNIVEFGAGTGKLMRDLLRIARMDREFYESATISIIDINEGLIEIQRTNLSEHTNIKWISSLDMLKEIPSIIIANEFFDALPIRQFHLSNNVWREKVISLDDKNNFEFLFKDIEKNEQEKLEALAPNAQNNAIYEESAQSQNLMKQISKFIKINSGFALIVDYGYDIDPRSREKNQYSSTLQALKNHQYTGLFTNLGDADLTSHVDLYSLKQEAKKYNLKTYGAISQGAFLKACGIELRLELLKKSNPNLEDLLKKQYNRLVSDGQMGELFKVISVSSHVGKIIGFE